MLFGKPLAKMQVTQFKLVEMLTQLTAARELIHACIRKRVRGEDATQEISMAKLFCGRTGAPVADECIQLHGGFGYMKESAAGPRLRRLPPDEHRRRRRRDDDPVPREAARVLGDRQSDDRRRPMADD